ncbi:hypothetical protein Back2_24040 [Nocardioides baekrokdamisoli]|uniref:Antitoxin VapB n=1 Tax=Nocardioides baekrokdamisoli TaxID=1804624 RepID=A0A3G9IGJ1_9ACTN|nr:type II toxin-antitoxin system VapB family antitoxin [Nocardioides baekrokdamisoli]BBH18117.1 hypothetical protein Back2_24040 [Nocardioides baekrokdamisoli]
MSLNIKNQRVHDLARRAAVLEGTTQTGAIEVALERLIADHDAREAISTRRERAERLLAWLDTNITDEDRAAIDRTMAEMYDEDGMPR